MSLHFTSKKPSRYSPKGIHRRITTWAGWDISLPAELPDPEPLIPVIWEQVRSELQKLLDSNALDEAHAAALDAYVDHVFVSCFVQLKKQYRHGKRWLLELDATGCRHAASACGRAKLAIDKANESNDQADDLYQRYVGRDRPHGEDSQKTIDQMKGLLDWEAVALDPRKAPGLLPDECELRGLDAGIDGPAVSSADTAESSDSDTFDN